jgi:hypothetical protein
MEPCHPISEALQCRESEQRRERKIGNNEERRLPPELSKKPGHQDATVLLYD